MCKNDNVLRDIPWVLTTDGKRTVEHVLKNLSTIQLDTNVPGYVYGTQIRFLMTVFPLIVAEAESSGYKARDINSTHVEAVLSHLDDSSHLLDSEEPFLQLPERFYERVKKEEYFKKPIRKLLPAEPNDDQDNFWNYETFPSTIPVEEAVLLLVSAYFYRSGGNLQLLEGLRNKNGSVGLRYIDAGKIPPAVEIIPTGESLLDTLLMSTPRTLLEGSMPHWADREGLSFKENTPMPPNLWLSSWSANIYYCEWDEELNLTAVGVGGCPIEYKPGLLSLPNEEKKGEEWKMLDTLRKENDPLYFYVDAVDKKGVVTRKLTYMDLSSDLYYSVARWNAEQKSEELLDKWGQNIEFDFDDLQNLIFLEHATGGKSQSFTIRHSRVVVGWKEEWIPDSSLVKVDDIYAAVLKVRAKLTGMFTDNGTMSHLKGRQSSVENEYWYFMQNVISKIVANEITVSEAFEEAKKAALEALNTVSSRRNTVNLKKHLQAENILRGFKE